VNFSSKNDGLSWGWLGIGSLRLYPDLPTLKAARSATIHLVAAAGHSAGSRIHLWRLSLSFSARKDPGSDLVAAAAERLAAIVESSDDAIVSKTLEGTILTWNPAAERIFGYSAAEMIGSSVYVLIPSELHGEERDILARIARGEHVAHFETTRLRKEGTRIAVSLSISPIRDSSGSIIGTSSIKRDITERKQAEDALRQAAKMEALGALAGGLAHDFNNQLHALSGFAHFVARDTGLGAAGRQDLMEIQKTIERMASLTRQLLAFARQQVMNPETLDLNTAIDDTLPMLQRLIGSNVTIDRSLSQGPKWVQADRAQLVQVLLNLVINARDAMPAGGKLSIRTETLEVSPGQLLDRLGVPVEPGAYAELAVSDAGQGIRPEHLPHIFEPVYTTKEVGQGTGLGLATVEGIVTQSGGRIQVASAVGQGTTLRILLPLTDQPAPNSRAGYPAPARTGPRARLLLVDDEDSVRAVVARMLQGEGYEVLGARDGEEALSHLELVGGTVDLVITDLVMPVMGGRELTLELHRLYPNLPVVWISGHPRGVELRSAEPAMEVAFLQKPISPRALSETIGQVVRRRRLGD
jgi:two-component system cell cycle sensor histidine kinase/response regulator CckA